MTPSQNQIMMINQLMRERGCSEKDLRSNGFPELSGLTGGRTGSAGQVIDWLINPKKVARNY